MGESNDETFLLNTINEGSSQYFEKEEHENCCQYLNEEHGEGNKEEQEERNKQEQEEGQQNVGWKKASRQRGLTRMVEGRHIIIEMKEDGKPVTPEVAATKFVS
jgi:hypothetical protein